MHSKGLVPCFFETPELLFQGWEMHSFNNIGDSLWFIPQHEVEWRFASGGVMAVIVDKCGHGDMFNPSFRVRTTENAEIVLNLLIESFCFSICLRVVCCGQRDFISEIMAKFSCKVCSELGAMVRDDLVKESKASIEFSENDSHNTINSDVFLGRA